MNARERLPNRRDHETVELDHGGFHFVVGIGRFADGRLAELFFSTVKSGTAVEAFARDAGSSPQSHYRRASPRRRSVTP